ncbi:glycosyltransferase [Mesorhizobium sp. BR1-1-9]|uniref:glycosyltransferase n=1 Tax=unclassified Mesorhizobium TaxID=325217 RepID=UPI001CD126DA|nr:MULTISPECIES: glycosyltransferase [unclassified Mesorhizobium]MBZ9869797.1 glycosyltransferase [Mesorhizobium sp. BR1-1-9]MBZ9940476.1 glycosyltransferase [Mesorhizobium sp. BR1-1-13]
MLKRIGFKEIFLPKIFPQDHNFRSASIDYSEDTNLSIPSHDLDKLNQVDWYKPVSKEYWDIANRYFDVLFFIIHDLDAVQSMSSSFHGAVILRAYGLPRPLTYTYLLSQTENALLSIQKPVGNLWFGHAYSGAQEVESTFLSKHALYLPLGLPNDEVNDKWIGDDKRILFFCPDIGFNPYYNSIYRKFKSDFKGLPWVVGGAQPVAVKDDAVLGFLPQAQHERNMQHLRVMFYHSQEPRHVHYHPFEAIRIGMPLVFMAGGLLDQLGGANLPGRARNMHEARAKIKRILNGDTRFIAEVKRSQTILLRPMSADVCDPYWRSNLEKVMTRLEQSRRTQHNRRSRRKRLAVIVPVAYRGGSLRGAKLLAEALLQGSQKAGEEAEIILGHLDDKGLYSDSDFKDMPKEILRRPFKLKSIDRHTAQRAMKLIGFDAWEPNANEYSTFNDGIKYFDDCDLLIIISDRLLSPVLRFKPVIHVVYDYIQRYIDILDNNQNQQFINVAQRADQIFVTTEFTRRDAIDYAGLPTNKVLKLPMLAPVFTKDRAMKDAREKYFIWTTNAAPHKNHRNALEALALYYEELEGELDCYVTGVNTKKLFKGRMEHLKDAKELLRASPLLREKVKVLGELPEKTYRRVLGKSQFLWHAGTIDNGTFSVVEAASLSVPSLSSDYPAMREMNQQFSLGLTFMDANDPEGMATMLKHMELNIQEKVAALPSRTVLEKQDISRLAPVYWKAAAEWL